MVFIELGERTGEAKLAVATNVTAVDARKNGWMSGETPDLLGSGGSSFINIGPTAHDRWIEHLVESSKAPFWICDTDIVFWESVEGFDVPELIKGRLEPAWFSKWTGCNHVERLHPCLMMLNPVGIRVGVRRWASQFPAAQRISAEYPMIREYFIPVKGEPPLFYDTCAGIWQGLGGTPFSDVENDYFDHLHAASSTHTMPADMRSDFEKVHNGVYCDVGLKSVQAEYYQRNPPRRSAETPLRT